MSSQNHCSEQKIRVSHLQKKPLKEFVLLLTDALTFGRRPPDDNDVDASSTTSYREQFIGFQVKTGDHGIVCDERRQGATIEIVREDPKIFGVGANIPLFKLNSMRLQEALRLDTRTTAGFRVEMNFHLRTVPTSGPMPPCIRIISRFAIKVFLACRKSVEKRI